MQYVQVESSNVDALGYDGGTNTLSVVFKNKTVYFYLGVPQEMYEKFVNAESKGKFFSLEIKGVYNFFALDKIELFPAGTHEVLVAAVTQLHLLGTQL